MAHYSHSVCFKFHTWTLSTRLGAPVDRAGLAREVCLALDTVTGLPLAAGRLEYKACGQDNRQQIARATVHIRVVHQSCGWRRQRKA